VAKVALGLISVAYKIVKKQSNLDRSIKNLADEMERSCEAAKDAVLLKGHFKRSESIVRRILLQVIECASFIRAYCENQSFRALSESSDSFWPFLNSHD
jgi:hypothetical protein